MHKEKLTALLFMIIIFGLLIGMFNYKENKPIQDFLTEYRVKVESGTPVLERVKGAIKAAETIMIRDTYRRSDFNELFGFTQSVLGKTILQDPGYGQIYKTEDGQITYIVEESDVQFAVESIARLKKELEQEGIPLLYVQAPFKVNGKNSGLPPNITDHADLNADGFLKGLEEQGIAYLDLRPLLRDGSKTQKELFFNTDHHWRIETAFDATWEIGRYLKKTRGFVIPEEYMEEYSYDVIPLEDYFQGSMGRRVGVTYGGLDDFTLITPKFTTNLTVEIHDKGYDADFTGSFVESMLVLDNLDPEKPVDTNRYAVYRGDHAELILKNNLMGNNNLLMIKDSFALPVYSFLAPVLKETRAIDMRYFERNVVEYAIENKPDLVLILYNGDCFNEDMFNFNLE